VKIGNGVILTISCLNGGYVKDGDTNMCACIKIRENKKTSKKLIQEEKIKVIKLVSSVGREICKKQSTGNDLNE
jgi:hypothetical protein